VVKRKNDNNGGNAANLGFEAQLSAAPDALRPQVPNHKPWPIAAGKSGRCDHFRPGVFAESHSLGTLGSRNAHRDRSEPARPTHSEPIGS